jgi:hypothetical protein
MTKELKRVHGFGGHIAFLISIMIHKIDNLAFGAHPNVIGIQNFYQLI